MTRSRALILAVVAVLVIVLLWPAVAQARVIEYVSVNTAGVQGNDWNDFGAPSADGRYVVFQSGADDLVANDNNYVEDIFVRDRQAGTTVRVSVASDGTEANEVSYYPCISADGLWVAFTSEATNLVPGDTNGFADVFLHSMATGATTRVSVSGTGTEGDDESSYSALNADGSVVAFASYATTLVAGDTNGKQDIFVHIPSGGATARVSVGAGAAQGNGDSLWPSLSGDGRYVCFGSYSDNFVANDTNDCPDIFVRDRTNTTTTRVSVASDGTEGDDWSDFPSISADGRYVAFDSLAGNLVVNDTNYDWDVFVRDLTGGTTTRASVSSAGAQGDFGSIYPSISGDGRFIAFESFATTLVSDPDTNEASDVFIRDRTGGTTTRVSVSAAGTLGNAWSDTAMMSADGRYVTFSSQATNLITPDTNADFCDVFAVINPASLTYSSIRGDHRYHTAQLISQAIYPTALPAGAGLVLAPGETFQEALCGAPLATAWGGPVLLTYQTALDNGTKAEMQRLNPSQVFCIGMAPAVISAVQAALPAATVTAINGDADDAYDMSYRVAKALGDKVGDLSGATAIVTVGYNFPDAIGVSPLACSQLWPILLTDQADGSPLHAKAIQALSELNITQALKVGTYADLGTVTGRANLSGGDRYYTCANVANWAEANAGLAFTHTGMATGDKFPDALASGPYLAKDDGILLLSPLTGPVPAPISTVLTNYREDVYRFTFIACIEPVIGQAKALLP